MFLKKKFTLVIFILIQPIANYGAQQLTQPQQQRMCLTDPNNPSSNMFRQWAFLILQRAQHPRPQEVTIVNAFYAPHNACAHAKNKTIHFNEKFYEMYPLGVKLVIVGHEAIHIQQRDDPSTYIPKEDSLDKYFESQRHEQYADKQSLLLGQCGTCGFQIAQYCLNEQKKQWLPSALPDTIEQLKQCDALQLDEYITKAHQLSLEKFTTHPSFYERAFYSYKIALDMKDKKCMFHQEECVRKRFAALKPQKPLSETQIAGFKRLLEKDDDEKPSAKRCDRKDKDQLLIASQTVSKSLKESC